MPPSSLADLADALGMECPQEWLDAPTELPPPTPLIPAEEMQRLRQHLGDEVMDRLEEPLQRHDHDATMELHARMALAYPLASAAIGGLPREDFERLAEFLRSCGTAIIPQLEATVRAHGPDAVYAFIPPPPCSPPPGLLPPPCSSPPGQLPPPCSTPPGLLPPPGLPPPPADTSNAPVPPTPRPTPPPPACPSTSTRSLPPPPTPPSPPVASTSRPSQRRRRRRRRHRVDLDASDTDSERQESQAQEDFSDLAQRFEELQARHSTPATVTPSRRVAAVMQ